MTLDLLSMNPELNDVSRVLALPDGGVVVSNKRKEMYHVVRLDQSGATIATLYTSMVQITGLILIEDEIIVLQKDGTLTRLKLVHSAAIIYKMDSSNLQGGTLLDQETILLADVNVPAIFTYSLSNQNKIVVKNIDYNPDCVERFKWKEEILYAVCLIAANQIQIFNSNWALKVSIGGINGPRAVKLLPTDTLVIADKVNHKVAEFNLQGCSLRDVLQKKDGITNPIDLSYQQPFLWVAYFNETSKLHQIKRFRIFK